jgi:hypothetical protein
VSTGSRLNSTEPRNIYLMGPVSLAWPIIRQESSHDAQPEDPP